MHYQRGRILNPFSAVVAPTHVLTLQHAGVWRAGTSFLFLDYAVDGVEDGFNDRDLYGEWYPTLSLGSFVAGGARLGPVHDVRLVAGVNVDVRSKTAKLLPGFELGLTVPGFVFVNVFASAILDASAGVEAGGAPRGGDAFGFGASWLAVFQVAGQSFSFAGNGEFMGGAADEAGVERPASVLAQPQLRWDVGDALFGAENVLHAGVEVQLWTRKLGTERDEATVQLLVVWRMD